MESSLFIALSRQATLRREMTSVANNIANMNTHAYKGEKMMFVDHVVRSKGGERIMGDKLAYVRDLAQYRDMTEGRMEETGNPLDVAIHGDGYFVVGTENGNRYTRNGHFTLNNEGVVVTSDGHPVLTNEGDPIETNPTDTRIEISRNGTITTDAGPIGQMAVVSFANLQDMQKVSNTLLTTEQPEQAVDNPHVIQGKLEGSNVEPIIEMTRMIEVHRAYDRAKNIIEKEDERIKKVVQLLRSQ